MSFLAPIAFWFAMTIPVVVVFYLLKRKRKLQLVSSTLLWQKFLAETQASSPFQKLRNNWLLLLQIILLILAVLALARPFMTGTAGASRLRVVILDGSASMQSTDVDPSRFEEAKQQALEWVKGLRDDEQMMVLLAGAITEVKQSPTTDKSALRRAIESCEPSDAPTRLADALKTAAAFTFEKQGEEEVTFGEIHLFSDGRSTDLDSLANKNLPLVYHRIGEGGRNVGIVSLDVRAHPEDPEQRAIFTSVANTSEQAIQTDLELRFGEELLEIRALDIAPTNTEDLIFLAPQTEDGIFTVAITSEDDLLADNQASIMSLMPAPIKVLFLSQGNRFLEKALRAASPNVELTAATMLSDGADQYDLVVVDNLIPIVWPNINTLAIHAANTNWFDTIATVRGPPIVDWKSTHPLLRFTSFDNVQIAEAYAVSPPAWGIPIVESPDTPLILAGERDQRRLVWIGFDPLQSTWPLRISFPIFIANAVDWLNPASMSGNQLQVPAGSPFRLNLYQPVSEAKVVLPDGTEQDLLIEEATREIIFSRTEQQGAYRLLAGTNETVFCVNLLDSAESTIEPLEDLPLGKHEQIEATTLKQANTELWRWILLAGLTMLLVEWWYYHKRTV